MTQRVFTIDMFKEVEPPKRVVLETEQHGEIVTFIRQMKGDDKKFIYGPLFGEGKGQVNTEGAIEFDLRLTYRLMSDEDGNRLFARTSYKSFLAQCSEELAEAFGRKYKELEDGGDNHDSLSEWAKRNAPELLELYMEYSLDTSKEKRLSLEEYTLEYYPKDYKLWREECSPFEVAKKN